MSEGEHKHWHFNCWAQVVSWPLTRWFFCVCILNIKAVVFSSNVPVFIHSTAFPERFSMLDFFSGIFTRDFLEILFQFTRKSFQGKLDGHWKCLRVWGWDKSISHLCSREDLVKKTSKFRAELTGSIGPSLQIKSEQKFAQNWWSVHHFPPFVLTCFPGHGLKSTTETWRCQGFCRGREWVCADHITFVLVFETPEDYFCLFKSLCCSRSFLVVDSTTNRTGRKYKWPHKNRSSVICSGCRPVSSAQILFKPQTSLPLRDWN